MSALLRPRTRPERELLVPDRERRVRPIQPIHPSPHSSRQRRPRVSRRDGRGGAGAGGGGRALLRGGRGGAGRGQDAQHVRQRLHRHRRRHGRRPAAGRRRPLQPPPPLPPRRRAPTTRPHRPGIGAGDEQALEGVPRGQHQPPGPALHGRQAVGHPAALVHQGQRLPRQQRRRAGLRLQDHRKLPRRRLLRIPRRFRHRNRKDRPAVHRGELAAGEEHLQRHRQPRHRLRLRRRARRRPGRDALPMISAAAAGRLNERPSPSPWCCSLSSACVCGRGPILLFREITNVPSPATGSHGVSAVQLQLDRSTLAFRQGATEQNILIQFCVFR